MPKLIYFATNGKRQEYELGDVTRIGRHPNQDLQLLDRMISKEHAEIVRQGSRYYLRDMDSRNGTMLNDEPVEASSILHDGDEISLGNHVLRYAEDIETQKDNVAAVSKNNYSSKSQEKSQEWGREKIEEDPEADYAKNKVFTQIMDPIRNSVDKAFLPESQIQSEAQLRRDYEKLRAGAELSVEAATIFDIDKLLAVIIEKAFQLFRADRIAILLRDESGLMQTKIAVTRKGESIGKFKISERLLKEVIDEKSAVLSGDALQDERFSSSNSIVVDSIRSTMCVPLMYQDEVIGVINLDTQIMTGAFVEKDLQILTGFARQAALTIQQTQVIEELRQNEVIRNNLRRIISPHLIDDVMSGKIELQKSGRRVEATVLFADIRGFSRMTEQNEPETIVNMLNDYYERMVDCIFRYDGAVDKFVGDEVMALWDIHVAKEDHACNAVLAAIDMMKAMDDLNRTRESSLLPPISIGIGIASGIMIAGYMGSTQSMSYTVIGDTVNVGARLCAAAQGSEILINEDTWKHVKDKVDGISLPPIMVKGKMEPVTVYRVRR